MNRYQLIQSTATLSVATVLPDGSIDQTDAATLCEVGHRLRG